MNKSNSDYKSILVIVTGLLVLSYIFKSNPLAIAALSVAILSLLSVKIMQYILLIWMKLAEILGWINTRILLAVVFYVFVFPFSLIYKLTSKDFLSLKKLSRKSMYHERNHLYTKKDMENIW